MVRTQVTDALATFWSDLRLCDTQAERLAVLRRAAAVYIYHDWRRTKALRAVWNKIRRTSETIGREDVCLVCWRPAFVVHHIIQICNGGDNREGNRGRLCKACHADIHPWMGRGHERAALARLDAKEATA